MSRVMGVDLGTERTGVAVASFSVANPLTVVEARDDQEIVRQLARLAREQDAREIVVGIAYALDGTEALAATRQRALAGMIEEATGLPVHLWDERLTTAEADRALIGAGVRRKRRREVVDKVAATLLLQSYLDANAAKPEDA